nr:alpha-L-arabinofuranosidase C-terminal domain-containing protein [Haloglycomyces albus]
MSRYVRSGVAVLAATAVASVAWQPMETAQANTTEATIDVDLSDTTPISDDLYGLFYEDINHAADGGLYAELVQNRSFEFTEADNIDYHALTAWEVSGQANPSTGDGLNANNPTHLSLTPGTTVTNVGFNSGMFVEAGQSYDFSVWARGNRGDVVDVALRDADGNAVGDSASVNLTEPGWSQYELDLDAHDTTTSGRLSLTAHAAVDVDMVSLFPEETFMGRENGMRNDLATHLANLNPSFLRFPGGCIVNTGSYDEDSRERVYNWKDTVGPVEERKTNHNFWGYNQSYGVGFYEYFQFAEDMGAKPLPVVPVGVTGCGDPYEITDPDVLQKWIDDALDLIEFANGPADSEWGSVRAEMGHPEPFGMEALGLGNEEYEEQFLENYPQFHDAIREAYPDIELIGNSGTESSGEVFDRNWDLMREMGTDVVDEHYYNSPEWFFANNDRYDSYDREGPHVFIGEYASHSNTWWSGLSEASYLTGVERNGDVVDMASYAPLLSNIDYIDWAPDMIWFDNHRSQTSVNYEVQRLFANNTGDQLVSSQLDISDGGGTVDDIQGSVGLGTWNTAASYDNVSVTSPNGDTMFADDFSNGADAWTVTGPGGEPTGDWSVVDGAYQQEALVEDARSVAGSSDWSNYTLEVEATKEQGEEGFLIMFGVEGSDDYYWWNLGGWGNTTSAVEKATGGGKQTLVNHDTTIEEGRTYDLKLEVDGRTITGWVDGNQAFSVTDEVQIDPLYEVVTRDSATGDTVVKVVNPHGSAVETSVELSGANLADTGTVTTLQCAPECDNVLGEEPVLQPEESTVSGLGNSFDHSFAAHSVTFIRLHEEGGNSGTVDACEVSVETSNDTSRVTVTNLGDSAVSDWELTWKQKGSKQVASSWGASLSMHGNDAGAEPGERLQTLRPGESATFSYRVKGREHVGSDYRLDGQSCG